MAIIGSDTFTEATDTALNAHTADVGGAWVEAAAQFTVIAADDNLRHNRAAIDEAKMQTDVGDDEMDVSASIKCASSTARRAGVTGRCRAGTAGSDLSDYYSAELHGDGSTVEVKLFKTVGGTRTELGSFALGLAADTFATVKLQIRDAAKKVFVDGIERISSADNDAALVGNQRAGVMMNGNSLASVRIDNWLVESVAGGAHQHVKIAYPGISKLLGKVGA